MESELTISSRYTAPSTGRLVIWMTVCGVLGLSRNGCPMKPRSRQYASE